MILLKILMYILCGALGMTLSQLTYDLAKKYPALSWVLVVLWAIAGLFVSIFTLSLLC